MLCTTKNSCVCTRSIGYIQPMVADRRVAWKEGIDVRDLSPESRKRYRNAMRQRNARNKIYSDPQTKEV